MSVPRAENSRWNGIAVFAMKFRRRTTLKHWCGSAAVRACGRSEELWTPCQDALLPAILSVRRHWPPMTACKRAIVCRIPDAPIDIREGCPLFPSVGETADSAVFHSCVGAATAIRSLWLRLGMGGLQEHRAGDQERCKRTDRDFCFHGRSFRGVYTDIQFFRAILTHAPPRESDRTWCTLITRIWHYLTVDQPPALQDLPGSCRRLCRRNFLGHEQLSTEIRRACHCLLQSGQRVPATLFDERGPLPFTGLFERSQLGVHGPRGHIIYGVVRPGLPEQSWRRRP